MNMKIASLIIIHPDHEPFVSFTSRPLVTSLDYRFPDSETCVNFVNSLIIDLQKAGYEFQVTLHKEGGACISLYSTIKKIGHEYEVDLDPIEIYRINKVKEI